MNEDHDLSRTDQNDTPSAPPLPLQEAELQTRQQLAMRLFHEAPAAYFQLNVQGRIVEVNAAGCGLLGQSREQLLRKHLRSLMASGAESSFALLLAQTFADDLRHEGEVQLIRADGSRCDVLLSLSPYQVDETSTLCLVIAVDITSHKQAQQQLLSENSSQQAQLLAQASKVRSLTQELEDVVGTFIEQLHLPVERAMNALRQHRQTFKDPPDDVLKTELAVQQVLALLNSVDRFTQMRQLRVTMRPVDLNKVLGEVLKNARLVMADRNVDMSSSRLPTNQGDSRAAYLILDEYIANALKFTKEQPEARIHVVAQETASEFLIGVEDNGTGFNMRQKGKLFQLFGRLHSSEVYEGSGIGLVTVRRTCERFGGRVWAEGKPDQGATFWFAWPKQPTVQDS